MDVTLRIDVKSQLFLLLSHLPFTISEDKRLDAAIAVSIVNNELVDGCFDYDIAEGKISCRLTASFRESTIGDGLFEYLIIRYNLTVDKYNDRFLALCKGVISLDEFIADKE